MNFIKRILPPSLYPYTGRLCLTLVGLLVAILFLTLGFWRTLLIVLLCGGGYALGSWLDRNGMPGTRPRYPY